MFFDSPIDLYFLDPEGLAAPRLAPFHVAPQAGSPGLEGAWQRMVR
jgi:hypothetical protein